MIAVKFMNIGADFSGFPLHKSQPERILSHTWYALSQGIRFFF